NAVDETALWSTVPVSFGNCTCRDHAVRNQFAHRSHIEIRPIDGFRRVEIPLVWLVLRNLAPTTHLGEVPDGIGIVWIASELVEEDVEPGGIARVARFESEFTRH